MGIVNVTPDSFSDGGRHATTEAAVEQALALLAAGADIIDVGGESTRPGAAPVHTQEERDRILPVIEGIRRRSAAPISVDTNKPEVAADALAAGASLLNNVLLPASATMARVAADAGAALILMHSRGTPQTMGRLTDYDGDVVGGVRDELRAACAAATAAGLAANALLLDPGIGFAKTAAQSVELLARLDRLAPLGRPLVVGVSRKSFIGELLDLPVESRLEGTLAAEAAAVLAGAHVIRTHDARAARRAVDVADALRRANAATGNTAA
jgi:dihydropteroate synthase